MDDLMMSPTKEHALAIYHAALDAVRADTLVKRSANRTGDMLLAGGREYSLAAGHVLVVGAGKASAPMAAAIEDILGDRLTSGIVVTKDGHTVPTRLIRVLEASHPVPDERSVEAGRQIVELAGQAEAADLVIVLLSGGASSLMELPEDGISLHDLQETTALLLRAGAPIRELNAIRACLSKIKAGGLARAAGNATVLCLALSDVLGNPLDVIGSGPCVETPRNPQRALDILANRGVIDAAPAAVARLLKADPGDRPPTPSRAADHVIVGDIWTALNAARDAAISRGLRPLVLTGWLEGEAREVGTVFGALARDLPKANLDTGIDCYIAGGETTVTVRGSGKGGRSQELAAAAALTMAGTEGVALLAAGTDGTDGPTDAAGGLVDGSTSALARARGHDITLALTANDTYRALAEAGALVITGPTLSNVGDLVVVVTP